MTTLMLSPQLSEDSQKLRRVALARGWQVMRWADWNPPAGLPNTDLCLYASPLFAARVSELTGWTFEEPADDWLLRLPPELLKRDISLTNLRQARRSTGRRFFKPAAFKTFQAGVYNSGEELPDSDKADQDNPVLTSEVVTWKSEFRFFLLDGQALTGSVYFLNGHSGQVGYEWPSDPHEYEQARAVAERAFRSTADHLPRSVVIDTGFIEGGGWAVVEANPSWGSGIYGCDPEQVLTVIAQASLQPLET